MTSAEPVLCRLELDAFGTPPRRSWLEARRCPEGFSVWFWDEHLYPDGVDAGTCDSPYNARAFAQIILDLGIERVLHDDLLGRESVPSASWRAVSVTGERGLEAYLLGCAFTKGYHDTYWLMQQSDASFGMLHELVETYDDEWHHFFFVITVCAAKLEYGLDVLSLLRRYELPASTSGVRELSAALSRDNDRRRQELEAEEQARIAPFRQQIDAIAAKCSDRPVQGAGYHNWPSPRSKMTSFLEDYVVEHGRMPRGKMEAEFQRGSTTYELGILDFDAVYREE